MVLTTTGSVAIARWPIKVWKSSRLRRTGGLRSRTGAGLRVAPDRRFEIEDRREIEVDAEPGQLAPMDATEFLRLGLLVIGGEPGEGRQRRQLRQRRREMPDDAALLVRGDDQRPQARGAPPVLERCDLGAQRLRRPAANVVAGNVDAADQSLLRKARDL